MPRSERDAVSRTSVNSYFARIMEAVKAGTFDQEIDRHLSWDSVALDQIAWSQLSKRLDEVLNSLPELAVESTNRLATAAEERIPIVVGLSAFRSPQSPITMLQASRCHQPHPREAEDRMHVAFGPRMAKALSNKWRCRILMELTIRPLSASQFVEEIGGSMTHISRCFRELAEWGLVEVLEERRGGRRGGGVERVYRSVRRPYFDTPTWETLPRIVREEMSQSFLNSYVERVSEAIDADTFDAEPDRHFSWKFLVVDRPAWDGIRDCLDEVLESLPELEAHSLERTERTDHLIPTIVGLACFRSPSRNQSP
jgi:predicted transcriptional regulator